ncbi:SCO2400 family protein, partial [Streptomyces luteogriseus]
MDYCDPCRRHLNGALACPGCGTSAETLRMRGPEYGGYDAAVAGHPGAGPERPAGPDTIDYGRDGYAGYGDAHDDSDADADADAGASDDGDYDSEYDGDGDGEHPGRAARRRGRGRGPAADGPGGASRRDRKAAAHRGRRRRT